MKYKDTKPHYMQWSMYKSTEDIPIEEWELDLSAPETVPDGTYDVIASPTVCKPARASGVVVKDGKFDLYPTMDAVEQAARRSLVNDRWMKDMKGDFDWVYIEALKFDPETQTFEASLGS